MLSDIHFDYFSFTIHPDTSNPLASPAVIASYLGALLGDTHIDASGLRHYLRSYLFLKTGSRVLYDGDYQRGTCHVLMSGAGCAVLGSSGIAELLRAVRPLSKRLVATRIDIAVDADGIAYMSEIESILKYWISPFAKTLELSTSSRYRRADQAVEFVSRTVYLGSRTSNRMVRIYGKEHDGRPYTRCEIETKAEFAQELLARFLEKPDVRYLAVSAFAGFFDVEGFLDVRIGMSAEPVTLPARQRLQRSLAWLLSCSTSVSMVADYYGWQNLKNMIIERQAELRKRRGKTPRGDTGVTNFSFEPSRGSFDAWRSQYIQTVQSIRQLELPDDSILSHSLSSDFDA